MRTQPRLDLAQLDSETTDLDLVIVASDKLKRAIGTPATKIAGAIHPCRRIGTEWIHEEARGSQIVVI